MREIASRSLLALYPAAWRNQYGAELLDTLLRRPLRVGVVADVLLSAARQRLRDEEPWRIVGWPALILTIFTLIWNIATPLSYEMKQSLQQGGGLSWLMAVAVGFWTYMRYEGQRSAVFVEGQRDAHGL